MMYYQDIGTLTGVLTVTLTYYKDWTEELQLKNEGIEI